MIKAEWKKLVLANYTVHPDVLSTYLPSGTHHDFWEDECYVSLVGFMFQNTQMHGIKIPYHINFEEVNLRFYVRRTTREGIKRGVVFIKEIVPRMAVTLVANNFYGEHYATMPMRHSLKNTGSEITVQYSWRKTSWHSLTIRSNARELEIMEHSKEAFFTEQYYGYNRRSAELTLEYEVAHPKWKYYKTLDYAIDVDFENVYGKDFAFLTSQQPKSVFLAEGSAITLKKGSALKE